MYNLLLPTLRLIKVKLFENNCALYAISQNLYDFLFEFYQIHILNSEIKEQRGLNLHS